MTILTAKNQPQQETPMPPDDEQRRKQAIARYLAGDKIEDICRQMPCSKSWLYKWKARYLADDPSWVRKGEETAMRRRVSLRG